MNPEKKIRKELDKLVIERYNIQKELDALDEKLNIFTSSTYFNVCDITKTLAKLVSTKEEKSYHAVFYDDRNYGHHFGETARVIAIVGAEDEYQADCKFSDFYNNGCVISEEKEVPILIGTIYYQYYNKCGKRIFNPDKVDITFKQLLIKYNIIDFSNKGGICTYKFDEYPYNYPYINDFIEYLFELQLNNGKHLNYEEMQKALNDFLESEKQKEVKTSKVKVRKIKKPINKES